MVCLRVKFAHIESVGTGGAVRRTGRSRLLARGVVREGESFVRVDGFTTFWLRS